MKGKNSLSGFIIMQTIVMFFIIIACIKFNLNFAIIPFYLIVITLNYLFFHNDFNIKTDSIEIVGNRLLKKGIEFHISQVEKLEFIDINLFLIDIKLIRIYTANNSPYTLFCNGILLEDGFDYEVPSGTNTFEDLYDYSKTVFKKTVFIDYTFFSKTLY